MSPCTCAFYAFCSVLSIRFWAPLLLTIDIDVIIMLHLLLTHELK